VDFSRAVEVAHQNIKHLETAAVVRADLLQLPFRAGTFDFVYCLGVLHHLSQPAQGAPASCGPREESGRVPDLRVPPD
jgi:2-polyprenyl-3-methyl-5-hydroxy-6-metoxy-1,4-benzoquinol methylase